jgi:hypothetical protein
MDTVYPGVDNIPLCEDRIAEGASEYHTNPFISQVMFSFALLRGAPSLNLTGSGGIHHSADPSSHPLIHSILAPMAITMHIVAK